MEKEKIDVELCDFTNVSHSEAFLELLNHYIQDPMGGSIPLDKIQQEQLIVALSANPQAFVFLLSYNNQFVGFSTVFELFSTFKVKPYLYIHDFVVYGNYRGKGLGRIFINGIVTFANQRDCCKITLEVRVDNHPAKKLYQNCGFVPCEPDMHFWTKTLAKE